MHSQSLILVAALVASVISAPVPTSPISQVERAEPLVAREAYDAILAPILEDVKRSLYERLEEIVPVKRSPSDEQDLPVPEANENNDKFRNLEDALEKREEIAENAVEKRGSLTVSASSPGKRGSLTVSASSPGKRGSLTVSASSPGKREEIVESDVEKRGSLTVSASSPGKRGSLTVPASSPGKRGSLTVSASSPGKRGSLTVPASSPGKL